MTFLVPVMLFGWVGLTLAFFYRMPPQRAALCSVLGGVLFLPVAAYDLQGLIGYNKHVAVSLGLLLAAPAGAGGDRPRVRPDALDIPMITWCFVSPLATSLSNGLGWYDAFSAMVDCNLTWGVVYWAGRVYFSQLSSSRELCRALVVGGLLYVPLCLFEVRMSPQLSNMVYGFFPHSFLQHFRYGGFRPLVFMQHGLMVSLWMAQTAVVAFWLWRSKSVRRMGGVRMGLLVLCLFVTTVLCKSANGWVVLVLGCLCSLAYEKSRSTRLLRLFILVVPVYILLRTSGLLSVERLLGLAGKIFDQYRIESLGVRLVQEDLFGQRAFDRLLFGWGGWGRSWPVDPTTGQRVLAAVDSLFIITYGTNGLVGLISLFGSLLIGPWFVLGMRAEAADPGDTDEWQVHRREITLLSLVVTFWAIDSLLNAMINQVYVMCAGALASYAVRLRQARALRVRIAATQPVDIPEGGR